MPKRTSATPLDGNLYFGLQISGNGHRVLRNAVYDTGGVPGQFQAIGIRAEADVIDNTVAGVFATAASTNPVGIMVLSPGTVVARNRVRGLVVAGGGSGIGIYAPSASPSTATASSSPQQPMAPVCSARTVACSAATTPWPTSAAPISPARPRWTI